MTEKLTVYRSTRTEVLAAVAKYRAAMKDWHRDAETLLTELGFPGRHFIVSTGMGQRWISGVEYHDDDPIPDGWRLRWFRETAVLVPHRGTNLGRAAAAKVQGCPVPNLPQADLPGMPGDRIFDDSRMRSPGLREMAGAIWISWGATGLPEIPADGPEREEHLGDDEQQRRVRLADHVDLAIWERVKLSAYYAAVEAQEEAQGKSGGEGR